MFKQICKFLSILVVSNFLFCSSAFALSPKSIVQWIFGHKNTTSQTTEAGQQTPTVEQKPGYTPPAGNEGHYITKYGVYFPDDVFDTYPPAPDNGKKE